jgi:ribosomal protein S6--L-glutamate ligase
LTQKFSQFITEEPKEQKYKVLNLVHDTPDDPNKTGDEIERQAKKMGIDIYQLNIEYGYFTVNEKGNLVAHNYSAEVDQKAVHRGKSKTSEHDEKGWEVDPENTICFCRIAARPRGNRLAEQVRLYGVKTINSAFTHLICDDKWLNYLAMERAGLRQPRTALLTHEDNIDLPIKTIGGKYPMILKTAEGTQGVGVIFIDSRKTLLATMQLITKIDPNIAMIIQEFIKTPYDVRVMVLNGEVVGQLKRPIISGDFRSNISQGNEPQKMELTELEKSECLKAAKSVKGKWLGIDFIPSEDRENKPPYFIEINGSPGTGHIDELNDINISKLVLETFKNRSNW